MFIRGTKIYKIYNELFLLLKFHLYGMGVFICFIDAVGMYFNFF